MSRESSVSGVRSSCPTSEKKLRTSRLSSSVSSMQGCAPNCSSTGMMCFVSMLMRCIISRETIRTWARKCSPGAVRRMLCGLNTNIEFRRMR